MENTHNISDLPQRQSPRSPAHDYSLPGAYYVTMCLYDRRPFLKDAALQHILETTWQELPQRFPGIILDEFVMMPDHVHFILWLTSDTHEGLTLSDVVGAYKSLTARAALSFLRSRGCSCGSQFWQRSFSDRVLRNEKELEQKRTYIRNNPMKASLKESGWDNII
jgi:putative transposase